MEDSTKISIQKDGNQWCVLWGSNLQEGIAGFGDTPEEAIDAFAMSICNKLEKTINCNNCETKISTLKNQEIYCDDCYEELKDKISNLEGDIYDLNSQIEELKNKEE